MAEKAASGGLARVRAKFRRRRNKKLDKQTTENPSFEDIIEYFAPLSLRLLFFLSIESLL
jgi:hypothetical protein